MQPTTFLFATDNPDMLDFALAEFAQYAERDRVQFSYERLDATSALVSIGPQLRSGIPVPSLN